MRLFLASLGMLFAGSIVGYLVIRVRADQWPPEGAPGLPSLLWLSTALIVLADVLLTLTRNRAQNAATTSFPTRMALGAFAVGLLFLGIQAINWWQLAASQGLDRGGLFAFTFIVLTVLHALHVVGGLVPIAVITIRSLRGISPDGGRSSLAYTVSYWHFLTAVWLVMLAVLAI
jgi:cytochrome c oxidase subunit 3